MIVQVAESEPLHNILFHAAEEASFIALDQVYRTAIKSASERHMYDMLFYIRYYYALSLYQKPENEDKAVALWESALKDDLPRSSLNVEATLPNLILKLGPIYLRKARSEEQDSDAQTYLQKISRLMPDEAVESSIIFPAKLYLARYHHVKGDENKARQITRSMVKLGLELLSDGEDDSDYTAFRKLLLAFLTLDDEKNAVAASVLAFLRNRIPHPRSPTDSLPDESFQYYLAFADCDGGCGRHLAAGSVMWWCKDCINIAFDKTCFQKLKEGNLESRVCDKDHEFLCIPVWDSKRLDAFPRGYVPVGKEVVSFGDWKRRIRRAYIEFDR